MPVIKVFIYRKLVDGFKLPTYCLTGQVSAHYIMLLCTFLSSMLVYIFVLVGSCAAYSSFLQNKDPIENSLYIAATFIFQAFVI